TTADELKTMTTPNTTSASVTIKSIQSGFSFLANSSPQFQCRQTEQRENQCRNPEPDDDFGLRPTLHFKMVVYRRHQKNSLTAQLERGDLNHHRQTFDHEHAAHENQKQLLLDEHRDRADCAAQRK